MLKKTHLFVIKRIDTKHNMNFDGKRGGGYEEVEYVDLCFGVFY